jgi:hypothetical protein
MPPMVEMLFDIYIWDLIGLWHIIQKFIVNRFAYGDMTTLSMVCTSFPLNMVMARLQDQFRQPVPKNL